MENQNQNQSLNQPPSPTVEPNSSAFSDGSASVDSLSAKETVTEDTLATPSSFSSVGHQSVNSTQSDSQYSPHKSSFKIVLILTVCALLAMIIAVGVVYIFSDRGTDTAKQSVLDEISDQEIQLDAVDSLDDGLLAITDGGNRLTVNGAVVAQGSLFVGLDDSFGQITTNATANRQYILPDSDGELCLDSNNCNFQEAGNYQIAGNYQLAGNYQIAGNYALQGDIVTTTIGGASGNISLQGTVNRVSVSQVGNTFTFSTPQAIGVNSSPSFNTISLGSVGTQVGSVICDASNNCGYATSASSFIQGGNSFGVTANLGTNDTHDLNLRTNGQTRLAVTSAGNISMLNEVHIGDVTTPFGQCTVIAGLADCESRLSVTTSSTASTTRTRGVRITTSINAASTNTANNIGISNTFGLDGNQNYTGTNDALSVVGRATTSGVVSSLVGVNSLVGNSSSTGVVTSATALQARVGMPVFYDGAISTAYGLRVLAAGGSGIGTNFGIKVDSQTVGSGNVGIAIDAASSASLWLTSDSGTSNTGITFGNIFTTPVNLYRSAAGTLRTDGNFIIGTNLNVTGTSTLDGNVAIGGSTSANKKLSIESERTSTSGLHFGQRVLTIINPTDNQVNTTMGTESYLVSDSGNPYNMSHAQAGSLAVYHEGTGTMTNATGLRTVVVNGGFGNIEHARGIEISTTYGDNAYGIDINSASVQGIDSGYGIRVGSVQGATDNYGIAIGNASTQTLWVNNTSNSTNAAGGIGFGSSRDTNLYRSAANVLRTDSSFYAGGTLVVSGSGASTIAGTLGVAGHASFGSSAGVNNTNLINSAANVSNILTLEEQFTDLTTYDSVSGITNYLQVAPTVFATANVYGSDTHIEVTGATGVLGIYGSNTVISTAGASSASASLLVGQQNTVSHAGSGSVTGIYGQINSIETDVGSLGGTIVGSMNSLSIDGDAGGNVMGNVLDVSTTGIVDGIILGSFTNVQNSGTANTIYGFGGGVTNNGTSTDIFGGLFTVENNGTTNTLVGLDLSVQNTDTVNNDSFGIRVGLTDTDYGIAVNAANTAALWLSNNTDSTTSAGGILFGQSGDTNLYRSAANTLRTDGSLSVGGAITINGSLTVTTASTFTGNLTVNGHIITGNQSGSTTITAEAAAGAGSSASISGNDTSGMITVNTGTGVTGGTLATITFANAYGVAPNVVITPKDVPGGATFPQYHYDSATGSFELKTFNALTDSQTYTFSYWIAQ